MSDDMPISAKYILDVMERVSGDGPGGIYIDDETPTDTILDGHVDMVAVADILSERSRAMVAAALKDQASIIAAYLPENGAKSPESEAERLVDAARRDCVRGLLDAPDDARAALDRLIAEAVEAERERAGPLFALLVAAKAEAERAMVRFPQPNYVISKFAEESGEVVKAAIHYAEGRETAEHVVDEMAQALAMLHRLCVEGDGVHGFEPVAAAIRARGEGE